MEKVNFACHKADYTATELRTSWNSPVSKRKKKKELGKSGKRRENLNGAVFRAEQDWTGYTSDFLVYPVKKRVFSPKKHFQVTLTPN